MRFALDTPQTDALGRITRFSGWFIPPPGEFPGPSLRLCLNGIPCASFASSRRDDVGAAFPDDSRAFFSGFAGDLVLPTATGRGDRLRVAIEAYRVNGPT